MTGKEERRKEVKRSERVEKHLMRGGVKEIS